VRKATRIVRRKERGVKLAQGFQSLRGMKQLGTNLKKKEGVREKRERKLIEKGMVNR